MPPFYAHSSSEGNPPPKGWQPLAEHLRGVAQLASMFAEGACLEKFRLSEAANAAGLIHDLGKYRSEFQQMLLDLHPRNQQTWHKQAGAAKAVTGNRIDIAFAIAGHHGGLPDFADLKDHIKGPSGEFVAQTVWGEAIRDCPELTQHLPPWEGGNDPLLFDLLVRLLFSCLVDADWTDTNAFERKATGLPPEPIPPALDPGAALQKVLGYICELAKSCRDVKIAHIRQEILHAALQAALEPTGLFTMTVPTGGGKTLSGFAFGLAHAQTHKLRRIIYVAPYLSIIEQNAREIRRALQVDASSEVVFEHHSLAEPSGGGDVNEAQSAEAIRRAENWDAPIIVTTSVQFFESLFSNRPGQCRKLHNITRSVVILDECQTLPPDLVAPTCSMLGQLAKLASCSIVLCTATQPAWKKREELPEGLDDVREIVAPHLNLFERLRRVTVQWPANKEAALDWHQVAELMTKRQAALGIVNTRKSARELFRCLRQLGCDDALHLSTTMCPAHRLEVIDEVRKRLESKRPCRLVSTQLIECGCDVDFPLVLREMAPLEAIIQSAGRCNREGLLNAPDGTPGGQVIVFRSKEGKLPPDGWYRAGCAKVEQDFLAMGRTPDIGSPEDVLEYFHRLYRWGELDGRQILALRAPPPTLPPGRFKTIWDGDASRPGIGRFRLIDEDSTPVITITWENQQKEIEQLLNQVRRHPNRVLFRRLSRFQVNLRSYELIQAAGSVAQDSSGVSLWLGGYDQNLGLLPDNADAVLIA